MDNYTNNFSRNLRYLRNKSKLSQEELGNKLNKDYSTIGKWENGTRSPNMEDTLLVCKFFGVTLDDMVLKDICLETIQKNGIRVTREELIKEVTELLEKTDLSEEKRKYLESTLDMIVKE